MFVARSRSSSCAPGTTLPLGSRTVTVTVPSDPCCANALGRARNTVRRIAANGRNAEIMDLRDIVNPPAHKIGLETDRQQPLAPAIPNDKTRIGKRLLVLVGFCILYSLRLSRQF